MTRILTLLIIVSSLFTINILSQDRIPEKIAYSLPVYKKLLPQIDSILRKYVDISCYPDRVIQFFIYSYPDSAVFILKHCQYEHEIFEHNVSGYIIINNCLIILYTDLDLLFKNDPKIIYNLERELDKKHLKERNDGPSMIDSPPWVIIYDRGTKKIVVIKKAREPYFNKVKIDTLKYSYPLYNTK